jgi:predicted DNA-binding protein (MmcQ/YjbR family)
MSAAGEETPMARAKNPSDAALLELRAFGLAYPSAHTKSPWPGHVDLAVKDKTFAYLSLEGEPLRISCKLPQSNAVALALPFTEPASYGLGKSGWVTAQFARGVVPPVEMLKAWIDESYRAQAPKKLVAALGAERDPAPASNAAKKAKPKARKSAAGGKTSASRQGRASRKR